MQKAHIEPYLDEKCFVLIIRNVYCALHVLAHYVEPSTFCGCSGAQPLLYGYPSAKTPPKTNGSTTAGSQRLFDVASIGMQSFTPRSFKENQVPQAPRKC